MGKHFGSRHATVAQSVPMPILTSIGGKKQQFYENVYTGRVLRLVPDSSLMHRTYVIEDQFRYTTGIKVSRLHLSWTKLVID